MHGAVTHIQIVEQDTMSSVNMAVGQYAAAIGGSAPIPPNQLVVLPSAVLTKYQTMIQELEDRSKNDRHIIAELLRARDSELLTEAVDNITEALSASASAVVNSLLSSVPDSKFYRDESEEL